MKLIPDSRAFATMRVEVASSVGPPNIMVPRQIGDTFRPLRPSLRYCISLAPQNLEHAVGHGNDALVDGDLGRDEDQASCCAHDARPRHQELADLAGLDEMHVELRGRHG